MNLKIFKPYQCSLEKPYAVLIELKNNSDQGLCLFRQKQILRSSKPKYAKS